MNLEKQQNQAPSQQYVIINNQMVPVYTISPSLNINPQIFPVQNPIQFQPPPEFQVKSPFNVVYQPVQGTPIIPQNQPIPVIHNSAADEYTHNVIYHVGIYIFLFAGCIGVQYGLYGSKTAAALWITSYVLLITTLVFFFLIKHRSFVWLLLLQILFVVLSLIFEMAAFAMAVSHPVLYNYQRDASPSNATFNNRRLETVSYTYDECWSFYMNLSYYDYYNSYSSQCDALLGFTQTSSDYETCRSLYDNLSYYDYDLYYKQYCDPILGYISGEGNYGSDYDFCYEAYMHYDSQTYEDLYGFYCDSILGMDYTHDYFYDNYESSYLSDNQCIQNGFYNPYKEYCYPLQYGMMVYASLNALIYLILFGSLSRKIYRFLQVIKGNSKNDAAASQSLDQPLAPNQTQKV